MGYVFTDWGVFYLAENFEAMRQYNKLDLELFFNVLFTFDKSTSQNVLERFRKTEGDALIEMLEPHFTFPKDHRFNWRPFDRLSFTLTGTQAKLSLPYFASLPGDVHNCFFGMFSDIAELKYELDSLARRYTHDIAHNPAACRELEAKANAYAPLESITVLVTISGSRNAYLAVSHGEDEPESGA